MVCLRQEGTEKSCDGIGRAIDGTERAIGVINDRPKTTERDDLMQWNRQRRGGGGGRKMGKKYLPMFPEREDFDKSGISQTNAMRNVSNHEACHEEEVGRGGGKVMISCADEPKSVS
jgi:hypothetical protein